MRSKSLQATLALQGLGKTKNTGSSIGGLDALSKHVATAPEDETSNQSAIAKSALDKLSKKPEAVYSQYEADFFGEEVQADTPDETVVVQIAISGGKVKIN